MSAIDLGQSLENLKLERDAIAMYDELARIERDPSRAAAFRLIAANERRHAGIWSSRLEALGATPPDPGPPRLRVRVIILLARVLGTHAVKDMVLALEGKEEEVYAAQASSEAAASSEAEAIAADEREHAEIWRRLSADRSGSAAAAAVAAGAADHAIAARTAKAPSDIALSERWHRAGRSGTLRAVIFGVSDGLVSNLALVMGVAGASAAAAADGNGFVLLAGVAGLLSGAFSMAAGEYISMQSQKELFERQIALERAELQAMPEEEEAELAAVFRAKGLTEAEAATIARRMFADPEHALDTLVREELGLDPGELGSPWGAAGGSFVAFALGAVLPVIPYAIAGGTAAFVGAIVLSVVALFGVGAGVSLLTGRSTLYSGARQVGIGLAAAAVTYAVGSLIGVSIAG